jgi:proteasome lid subunit RPN8/RPN11
MFERAILDAIQRHAISCWPKESCGLVTAAGYEPLENQHEEPEAFFRLPAEADERVAAGEVLAVVHSHCMKRMDDPTWPSIEDQRQQLAMAIPWGLCIVWNEAEADMPWFWGDGIPELPLMPRDFRWGPAGTDGKGDCFALVRDYYKFHLGLEIPDVPRHADWINDEGPNLYLDGIQRAGFVPITQAELQPHDAILLGLLSAGRPNHAAIYLGEGLILHHMQNRMVQREAFHSWRRGAVMFLRPPSLSK